MTWWLAAMAALLALQDAPRVEVHGTTRTITNASAPSATARNILIIGNSLTYFNEMPWILEQIAQSKNARPRFHVEFSGASGMSLEQHWKQGKAARRIADARWDVVVLQAQSTEALRARTSFEEYAKRFGALIRSRHARAVIVETWAPRALASSQQELNDEYRKVARQIGAEVAPVGSAWVDLESRGVELFVDDVHANVAGSYLMACILYSMFSGQSPEGATHTFDVHFDIDEFYRRSLVNDRIDDPTAAKIQAAAWTAVRGGPH